MMTRDPVNAASTASASRSSHDPIVVGLVNNMPDAALRMTERQFGELLGAAAGRQPVELRLYTVPEVPRGAGARAHIAEHYEDISALDDRHIDGLIVTGTQPRARNLRDEPYWASLAQLVDWAEKNTTSTIWSCLASHAAVLHLDGIERRPFESKLSGVFICAQSSEHGFAAGFPSRWPVPHSRYNDLPEDALVESGYSVVSRSKQVGADLFLKQRRSLFVFLQGHPEYDRGALMREYRADIGKFLGGERPTYPEMPRNYFDRATRGALMEFRGRAEEIRSIELLADLPLNQMEGSLGQRWRNSATSIYRNWLAYLAERRELRPSARRGMAAIHAFRAPREERSAVALLPNR